jgi:hypothetical protein
MDAVWQEVWQGVRADFSDLPGVVAVTQLILRMLLATVLGTVLALMILALLPRVRPDTDTDETRREDTGALQHTAVSTHDARE